MVAEQSMRTYPCAYDLYKKNGLSDVIESGFVEYSFSRNLLNTGRLEFVVSGNSEHMIIPSKTYLKLVVELEGNATRTQQDGTVRNVSLADGARVTVVNNIMHSMFESLEVKLNNQSLTKEPNRMPYIAYFQTLFNNPEDAMDTYLQLAGWKKDTPEAFDAVDGTNAGGQARRALFSTNGNKLRLELIGKLYCPLFFQEKALPTQVTMTVHMTKGEEKFFLMHEAGDFKLNMVDAKLMVQKVQTVPGIQRTFNQMMDEGHNIPYFLKTPLINFMTIEAGSSQFIRDNLFLGKLPHHIVMGMVDTEAFQGKSDMTPLHFQHFGLRYICLSKDGIPYPRPAITLDIENGECAEAYHHFMTSLNAAYTRWIPGKLTLNEYMHGYTLFSYDMSPDQLGSVHPGSIHGATSNVRLEMKFKTPLTRNVTLVIYSEEEFLMEIRRDRTVTINN